MSISRPCLPLAAGLLALPLLASPASQLYKKARKAERAGAVAQAYLLYSEAAAADPRNPSYRAHAEALAPLAAMEAKATPQDTSSTNLPPPGPGALLKLEDVFENLTAQDLASQRQIVPPPELTLANNVEDFDLEGAPKSLFEALASRFGLQVVFDGDYPPGRPLRFHLDQVTPRVALHALEAASGSFAVPLSENLILVSQDTEAKRKDLEQVVTAAVPVPNVLTTQEIVELGQLIKQTINVERMYWDAPANQIVLRDRVSRVLAAQSVLMDLIAYRGQVAIDLDFLEVSAAQLIDVGVDVDFKFPITYIGSVLQNTNSAANTISLIRKLGLGHIYAIALPNVNVIAQLTNAGARTLLKSTIVATEGQASQFHAGDRYPILTSAYVGQTTPGQVYTPPPSFTFEDLGLSIKATPRIHGMDEVSLDLESEFKVLGPVQSNSIPIISDRKLKSVVRMKQNQWALIAGLTSDSTTRTWSGPPWLYRIPYLANLVSRFTRQGNQTWIVLALRPRLIGIPPSETVTHEVPLGSERRSITPL